MEKTKTDELLSELGSDKTNGNKGTIEKSFFENRMAEARDYLRNVIYETSSPSCEVKIKGAVMPRDKIRTENDFDRMRVGV